MLIELTNADTEKKIMVNSEHIVLIRHPGEGVIGNAKIELVNSSDNRGSINVKETPSLVYEKMSPEM